jgi:hypothetical protein
MTGGPTTAPPDAVKRLPSPLARECKCPGAEVPFYCPAHGRVENPNWPLLKQPAGLNVEAEPCDSPRLYRE